MRGRRLTPEEAEQSKLRRKALARARYAADPERHQAHVRRYRAENRDLISQRRKAQYASDPERFRETRRLNYRANLCSEAASRANQRAKSQMIEGVFTAEDMREKFNEQGGKCFYCRTQLESYHIDHKIPLCRGGSNWPSNIVCACESCNLSKGRKTDCEYMMVLWSRQYVED